MTAVGLQPITLRRAVLTIAEDDYTASVNEVTFAPEVEVEWVPTFQSGSYLPIYTGIRWFAVVGYAQDFTTPGSLTRYLFEHAAQTRTLVFTPVEGGSSVTADAMIVPGRMGGPTAELLTATVILPLFDEPLMSGP